MPVRKSVRAWCSSSCSNFLRSVTSSPVPTRYALPAISTRLAVRKRQRLPEQVRNQRAILLENGVEYPGTRHPLIRGADQFLCGPVPAHEIALFVDDVERPRYGIDDRLKKRLFPKRSGLRAGGFLMRLREACQGPPVGATATPAATERPGCSAWRTG